MPRFHQGRIICSTTANTIEIIDALRGEGDIIAFPQALSSFSHSPVIFDQRAYVTSDGRLMAIDLNTKTTGMAVARTTRGQRPEYRTAW